jgi:hypothetical protein
MKSTDRRCSIYLGNDVVDDEPSLSLSATAAIVATAVVLTAATTTPAAIY